MNLFSVLVTGANRGIGLEFVRQLVKLPNPAKHVFATCRKPEDAKDLEIIRNSSADSKIHLMKMDVTKNNEIEGVAKIVEQITGENGLTLLINNAGILKAEKFTNMTVETTNFILAVNAIGPVMVTQTMLPLLRKSASRQEGSQMSFSRAGIWNISSGGGSINNVPLTFPIDSALPAYKISKAALNMGMRIISAKVKEDHILVIMMCPGWVKTDMGSERALLQPHESIAAMLSTVTKLNEFHHGTFMDRMGNPYPW